jgi:hypothetical protein
VDCVVQYILSTFSTEAIILTPEKVKNIPDCLPIAYKNLKFKIKIYIRQKYFQGRSHKKMDTHKKYLLCLSILSFKFESSESIFSSLALSQH